MSLASSSRRVARLLQTEQQKIVFAESCTAGLVAASLGSIPGISNHLCGSMVTYRTAEKRAWLGISAKLLRNPGPVSEIVARKMAERVLRLTEEATLAVSVTGHLGPHAPDDFDGVVFIAIARRTQQGKAGAMECEISTYQCRSTARAVRQREVAEFVLQTVMQALT